MRVLKEGDPFYLATVTPVPYCECGHAEILHYGMRHECQDRVGNATPTAVVRCSCDRYRPSAR